MYIIFHLQHVDTNEANQLSALLQANRIQFYEHDTNPMTHAQHYLWIIDERTCLKSRRLIDDFYQSNPEFNKLGKQDYVAIRKWYYLLMTLFALVSLALILFPLFFD